MIKILESRFGIESSIFHFQGKSHKDSRYNSLFLEMCEGCLDIDLFLPDNLSIIVSETDESRSPVIKQLKRNGISYINACEGFEGEWSNDKKFSLVRESLCLVKTDYVLVLDGDDVIINSFDGIIEKFLVKGCGILWCATVNKYPKIDIGIVREDIGRWKYLNCGCVIGRTDSLVSFFGHIDEMDDSEVIMNNEYKSDQYIIRKIDADFNDLSISDIDWRCDVFMSFSNVKLVESGDRIIVE